MDLMLNEPIEARCICRGWSIDIRLPSFIWLLDILVLEDSSTSPSGPLDAFYKLELNIASLLTGMFASAELSYGGAVWSRKPSNNAWKLRILIGLFAPFALYNKEFTYIVL